jgi:anti-anti-sigma factor
MEIMTVEIERLENLSVIYAAGEIDAVTCMKLEEALNGLFEGGEERIILDMEKVSYISSAGLRVILTATQELLGEGQFVLSSLSEDVKEILEMTGFPNIIEIYNDLETARSALSQDL